MTRKGYIHTVTMFSSRSLLFICCETMCQKWRAQNLKNWALYVWSNLEFWAGLRTIENKITPTLIALGVVTTAKIYICNIDPKNGTKTAQDLICHWLNLFLLLLTDKFLSILIHKIFLSQSTQLFQHFTPSFVLFGYFVLVGKKCSCDRD